MERSDWLERRVQRLELENLQLRAELQAAQERAFMASTGPLIITEPEFDKC